MGTKYWQTSSGRFAGKVTARPDMTSAVYCGLRQTLSILLYILEINLFRWLGDKTS